MGTKREPEQFRRTVCQTLDAFEPRRSCHVSSPNGYSRSLTHNVHDITLEWTFASVIATRSESVAASEKVLTHLASRRRRDLALSPRDESRRCVFRAEAASRSYPNRCMRKFLGVGAAENGCWTKKGSLDDAAGQLFVPSRKAPSRRFPDISRLIKRVSHRCIVEQFHSLMSFALLCGRRRRRHQPAVAKMNRNSVAGSGTAAFASARAAAGRLSEWVRQASKRSGAPSCARRCSRRRRRSRRGSVAEQLGNGVREEDARCAVGEAG